ncbi:hypothetical protein Trydic_g3437 [Trypoxylus dichotomus]
MRDEGRTVAMLVNNAPYHLYDVELSNVKLVFISPNSNLQPLDQGVINSFKLHYQKLLLSTLAARIKEVSDIYELASSVDIVDAVRWISQAWECVEPQTIVKCFDTCRMDAIVNSERTDHDTEQIQIDLRYLRRQINIETDEDITGSDTAFNCNLENFEEDPATVNIKNETSTTRDTNINEDGNNPLADCLKSIKELRNLAVKLGNNKLIQLLGDVKLEFEKEIFSKNSTIIKKETLMD